MRAGDKWRRRRNKMNVCQPQSVHKLPYTHTLNKIEIKTNLWGTATHTHSLTGEFVFALLGCLDWSCRVRPASQSPASLQHTTLYAPLFTNIPLFYLVQHRILRSAVLTSSLFHSVRSPVRKPIERCTKRHMEDQSASKRQRNDGS